MVTGQSLALYSRLHLIVRDAIRIRWILYMIILNAVITYIPLIVLAFGVNSPNPTRFLRPYVIYDKLQIVVIFVQEAIISIMYIYETSRLLGSGGEVKRKPIKRLMIHLLIVNLIVLALDITLLGIQFAGDYEIQVAYKSAVYSIKLKIEFSVLNRLINVVKNRDVVFSSNSDASQTLATSTWRDIPSSSGLSAGDIEMDAVHSAPRVVVTSRGK